ncbi:MAG: general secretion pathway protein GspB [Thiogranum sp.]|nr:general secretion pathway protein GspB [Thiogranum sp.]
MSYILEALRKAEQQRELGRVPGIASDHDAKSTGRQRWWLWVLIVAVNIAVLATVLLWAERKSERPLQAVAEVPADAPSPAVARPSLPQPSAQIQAPQPVPGPERMTGNEPVPANVPDEIVQQSMEEPLQRKPLSPAAPSQPLALPVWPQIPGHVFAQLNSSLHLDVHVYSDQPQDRFVLLNLRKYHEGDELQEGPRLDEITPEGVILSFRGERFRVQRQ